MIKEITADELTDRLKSGEQLELIDVCTTAEFSRAHLPNSVNIPLNLLPSADLAAASGRPIVFICQAGVRSIRACEIAISLGFNDVCSLADGTQGWIKSGLPYE